MAANKIKFKMSIKEVSFEFEGDYEQGRVLQQGINQTMAGLANLQSRAMGAEEPNRKQIEAKVVDPPRRKRRRRNSIDSTEPPADGSGEVMSADEVDSGADRRSTGVSPKAVVMELRQSDYFAIPRTAGEVRAELHRRGYSSIRATDLTSPLGSLTRQKVLSRDKDEQKNQWVYSNGSQHEAD